MSITKRKEIGNLAENLAARYLESRGYEIIAKNYQKPWGEIDIIAFKDNVCVFVEVKANSREFIGGFNPEVRVDYRKLNKITKTAELYMTDDFDGQNTVKFWSGSVRSGQVRSDHGQVDQTCPAPDHDPTKKLSRSDYDWPPHSKIECGGWQVDVISVTFYEAEKKAKIRHFKNVAEAVF